VSREVLAETSAVESYKVTVNEKEGFKITRRYQPYQAKQATAYKNGGNQGYLERLSCLRCP